ncbi:MAG: response regulator, partial [Treponema sp.]|nr:response regulator [Treponema sp.]
ISGHDDYTGIEISTDISNVLNTLVESTNSVSISEVITDKILSQTDAHQTGSIETRFYTDNTVIKEEINSGDLLKVALIDDDIVI